MKRVGHGYLPLALAFRVTIGFVATEENMESETQLKKCSPASFKCNVPFFIQSLCAAISFNQWCWGSQIVVCKIVRTPSSHGPYAKINSKWIKDLNVRNKTANLLEENIDINLHDLGLGNSFLDIELKTQAKGKWTRLLQN